MAKRTYSRRASWRLLALATAIITMVSACSISFGGGGPASSAEELIEGDLADNLNIVLTDANCDDPASELVGETFACTADYEGQEMRLSTVIEAGERIFVEPTNLLMPAQLDAIEATVADLLNDQADYGLSSESLNCGASPIVLEGSPEFLCAMTDPATGEVYDTQIEMTDLSELGFNFEVATDPR